MPNRSVQRERIFHALAHPTRLAVIEQLSRGPAAMTELASGFDMALPSFSQHLDVLAECDLIRSRKRGRVRTFTLNPAPLQAAENWLAQQRSVWEARLNRLDNYLIRLKKEQEK
jgi:DNA-binding transcriptional ArsR family regulator